VRVLILIQTSKILFFNIFMEIQKHKICHKIKTTCSCSAYIFREPQGVQEKLCFFTIHCNPSLAYIATRDLQRSQRNVSVQSLLLAVIFFRKPIAADCWRGRGGKPSRIFWKKNKIFNEHPVYFLDARHLYNPPLWSYFCTPVEFPTYVHLFTAFFSTNFIHDEIRLSLLDLTVVTDRRTD